MACDEEKNSNSSNGVYERCASDRTPPYTTEPKQGENRLISDSQRQKYDRSKRKYVVFLCAFITHIFIGGFNAMLGMVYVDIVREFDANRSEASLMQSLARGFIYIGGPAGEIVMRKFGITKCVLIGCLLVAVCLMASSFATNITTVVILIGVGAGSGLNLPFFATFVCVERAFDHLLFPRFMAYSVVGGGVGMIVLPYMAELILEEYGWRGMFMILSAVYLNLVVTTIATYFNLPKDGAPALRNKKNIKFDFSIFRNHMFIIYLVIMIPYSATGFVESWYVADYLVTIGYTREQGSILLSVIGAASTFGRLLSGFVHPVCIYTKTYIMHNWTYLFVILAAAHAMFSLIADYSALFASSIVYGISFGMIVSQCAPVVREAVGEKFAVGQGVHCFLYGISSSLGGLFAGLITDASGSYDLVFYTASIASLVCSILSVLFTCIDFLKKRRLVQNNPQTLEITHI